MTQQGPFRGQQRRSMGTERHITQAEARHERRCRSCGRGATADGGAGEKISGRPERLGGAQVENGLYECHLFSDEGPEGAQVKKSLEDSNALAVRRLARVAAGFA